MKALQDMTGEELTREMRSAWGIIQRREGAIIRARRDQREAHDRVTLVQFERRRRKESQS